MKAMGIQPKVWIREDLPEGIWAMAVYTPQLGACILLRPGLPSARVQELLHCWSARLAQENGQC